MKIVIAIGGNSLIKDSSHISAQDQMEQVMETSKIIAEIAQDGHELVVSHGNGPQVGYLLRMSELAEHEIPLFPLDYCVASTQGAIGFQMQNAIYNHFIERGIHRSVATLVTQTIVDKNDPAFSHPSKPIGSFFNKEQIEEHARTLGWSYMEDSGRGYRRVVASPIPKQIVEKDIVLNMLKQHTLVITVGGGGIPVVSENGKIKGVEAVIDKDLASSLLAKELEADLFIISTAVDYAYINFNQNNQEALETVSTEEMRSYLSQGFFGKGSMEPKIKAALQFTESCKKTSIITSPENIHEAILGRKGTRIVYSGNLDEI
ncbi:MAG TPA: carbamate kinase [Caldisericia bacterium]|nr:carbamate kinase [Caldisericia bacterium]